MKEKHKGSEINGKNERMLTGLRKIWFVGGARRSKGERMKGTWKAETGDGEMEEGLTIEKMLGDFDGRPHGEETPRMILLGRKHT